MELTIDLFSPSARAIGLPEASRTWTLPASATETGSVEGSRTLPYSFMAECECPDDCLRDHGND